MTVDVWQAVTEHMSEGYPTVPTIISGFAAVVGLKALDVLFKLHKQSIEHEGLPGKLDAMNVKLDAFGTRFDDHCDEERKWQEDSRAIGIRAQNYTQETLMKVEEKMEQRFDALVDQLPKKRVR